ncbi:S66 peptidase family protein [Streptomyces sp. HC307]|uniref:S66 peptidase family protein n=1 Tax=Streptomyces flavusporus TaxID=3385496 RepID=UPI0039170E09
MHPSSTPPDPLNTSAGLRPGPRTGSPLRAPRLRPGDRVRIVSPSSRPSRRDVERGAAVLASWGLRVEVGDHVFDQWGPMAGRDWDRLADLNAAFADPGVRVVFATRGGAGAYRIADGLDTDAVRRDPKPLVGFSDVTHLHLALWRECRLATVHGPFLTHGDDVLDSGTVQALRHALTETEPITLHADPNEVTEAVTVDGTATGVLIGGLLTALSTEAGAGLPSLDGAILFLEHPLSGLRNVDRALTQLRRSGVLNGLRGVALGQFFGFEGDVTASQDGGWSIADVLIEHFGGLGIPVLGGLPVGHRNRPATLPLGAEAVLDGTAGTLTVGSAVT